MEQPPQPPNPEPREQDDLPQLIDTLRQRLMDALARGEPVNENDVEFMGSAAYWSARDAFMNCLIESRHLNADEARLFSSIVLCSQHDSDDRKLLDQFMVNGSGNPADLHRAVTNARTSQMSGILVLIHDLLATYFVEEACHFERHRHHSDFTDAAVLFPRFAGPVPRPLAISMALGKEIDLSSFEGHEFTMQIYQRLSTFRAPFHAYLRVPGVDAADPKLIEHFQRRYLRSVPGLIDLLHPDLPQAFQAIDLGGTIHVFKLNEGAHE